MSLSSLDQQLLSEVIAWRNAPAKADVRGLPSVSVPLLGRLRRLLPEDSAPRLLARSYTAALKLSQPAALLRQAGVESVEAMRQRPLTENHALSRRIARQSGWLAGGSGAVFGVAGAAGMAADAPALLLLGLRALIRVGYCYGELATPALVIALFALASADTDDEKRLAWQAVLTAPGTDALIASKVAIADDALRDGLERAAEREFAKQALSASLQRLALTLAQRLGLQKAAGALPVIGALVGGAVNIRFMVLLTDAARVAFAARQMGALGISTETLLIAAPLPGEVARPKVKKPRVIKNPPSTRAKKSRSGSTN